MVNGSALCAALTLQEQVDSAAIIAQGTFLPGPDFEGRLIGPATFEVSRYLKGTGGSEILAQTALTRHEETGQLAGRSAMVDPTSGQSWVLFGDFDAEHVLRTSRCAGSQPIDQLDEPAHRDEANRFLEELEELVGEASPPSG